MSEPQGFFGAIMKPFSAGSNTNNKSTNLVRGKHNCSSPRDLPHDHTEPESDAESYFSPEKKLVLKGDEDEDDSDDDELQGDFAPVVPTKPFTKRGSFLSMFRKSNSQKIVVDPEVLEAAESHGVDSEKTENEGSSTTANYDDKGMGNNLNNNAANDAAETERDEKSPEAPDTESTNKNSGGLLGIFYSPKETINADVKTNCQDAPTKESTVASVSVASGNKQEADDSNSNTEQSSDSEDSNTHPKEGLGFFGKLFQRKGLPPVQDDSGVVALQSGAMLGSGMEHVENLDHLEYMYNSTKEVLNLSDETNSSEESPVVEQEEGSGNVDEPALAAEEESTNEPDSSSAGDEKASVQSEDLESSSRSLASAGSQKRSSFLAMFLDTGTTTEEVSKHQTETEDAPKEALVQEARQSEDDSIEVSSDVQFYAEETGLELEAEAGNSEITPPLDDPYTDDNEKGQKERLCCSFPFC